MKWNSKNKLGKTHRVVSIYAGISRPSINWLKILDDAIT